MGKQQVKGGTGRVARRGGGSGTGAPSSPQAGPRAQDNSVMQARLATTAPAAPGLDAGAAGLLDDFTRYRGDYGHTFGQAVGLALKAHGAQDAGDIPGYHAALGDMRDENAGVLSSLDWFLPGRGVLSQLDDQLDGNPDLANVPAFHAGYMDARVFGAMVAQQRALLLPFLVPRTVHGKMIPPIPGIALNDLSYTDAVQGQEEELEPLFSGATEIRTLLAGATTASGPAAASIATDIAAGAMSDYAPGSGEFEYLYLVVQNSKASAEVKARVDWLLGRDDFKPYEGMFSGPQVIQDLFRVKNDVQAGNPAPAAPVAGPSSVAQDDLGLDEDDDGICRVPGTKPLALHPFGLSMGPVGGAPAASPAVSPTDKIAPGAVADRAAKKGAGLPGFDTSKLPEPEQKEEKPKTSNGKPSDKGMGRVQTTTSRDGKLVVGDGKVGGDASAKRVTKKRSGESTDLGVQGAIDAGENLSGHAGVSGKHTGKHGGTIGGTLDGGVDEAGHFRAKGRVEGGLADPKGNGVGYGKTIGVDHDNGVNVATDVTVKKKNPNGSTTSTTGGISATQNGKFTASGGRVTEDAKGNKVGTTGSAGYNAKTGETSAAINYSNKDKAGNDKGSVGATGSVDLDGSDGTRSMKGSISASKGAKSVSLSGGYTAKVEQPKKEGGRWVVSWVTDLSGQVSGGVKGKKAGVSGHIGGDEQKTGRRSFANEADAKAFFANPSLEGAPADAKAAAAMGEGDQLGTESSFDVGVDGSANIGMVQVGGGGSHSSSDFQTVTRGQGGKVRVEIGSKELDDVHGSVGLAGVSAGAGKSWASQESQTVEFDLDTPEGVAAYAHHQKFHALPRGARGWRIVGDSKGNATTNTYSLGLLGVKVGSSHTVAHEEEHADGNTYERDSGTDAHSVSVPLLGSYSRSHRLSMLQVNDGRSYFNTESTVQGSDLDDVQSGLARSAMETEKGSGGTNKGTYRLQTAISEADMDRFIAAALTAEAEATFQYAGGLHAADGLGDLQDGLRAAGGDKDKQRRVLARWVADEGADALTTLHAITHGKFDESGMGGTAMFVAIDGDPYMNGMKGQLDLELRIQQWDQRLSGGERGPGLVSEIRKDIVFQREKARHLELCGELPHRVFEQEYDRIRSNGAILESVLQRAMVNDGTPTTASAGLESPRFMAFRRACVNLSVARTGCDHAHEDVYGRVKIEHWGAFSSDGKGRDQEIPEEKDAFEHAFGLFQRGEAARQAATLAESISDQPLDESSVAPLTAMVTKARSEYLRSERFYRQASDEYLAIDGRTIFKASRGTFAGQRMLPGT